MKIKESILKNSDTSSNSKEGEEEALVFKKKQEKFFELLEKNKILLNKYPFVFDFSKVKEILEDEDFNGKEGIFLNNKKRVLTYPDCFRFLLNLKGLSMEEYEEFLKNKNLDNKELKLHSVFDLPTDKKNLIEGSFENKDIDLEKFVKKNTLFREEIILEDGTKTNVAEVFISKKLKQLSAHRNEGGDLKIIDPRDEKEKKYTGEIIGELFGKEIKIEIKRENGDNQEEAKRYFAELGGFLFTEKFLNNLYTAGVFKKEDFKVSGNTFINEIYETHKKKINSKAPYISFSNKEGGARYYIGRGKIVGTSTKIDENIYSIQLDSNLVGILEKNPGKKDKLLYVFESLNENEYREKKREVEKSFSDKGKIPGKEDFTNNVIVKGEEMKERLKEYKITEFLPKKEKETTEDYAERISQLSDLSYVLDSFRNFFTKTGIGVHRLPWNEQLVIADILLEQKRDHELIEFVSKFGLNGLRTFLSVEQGGRQMGDKILELSNSIPEEATKVIFEGYSNILNEAEKLKTRMKSVKKVEGVDHDLVNKMPAQIHEALLLRTKDILLGANILAQKKELKGLKVGNVREAMDGISLMLKILNDIGFAEKFSFQEKNRTEQNFKYEVVDKRTEKKYGLKIFLRPKAEKNAQARVNIELSFDTDNPDERLGKAFLNTIESHTQNKTTNASVLRIGIDREDRNGQEQVSLDIGRSAHSDEELTRTGDVLGNILAVSSNVGNHTVESFDPRFGKEEIFTQLVKLFENYLVSQKNQ